MRRRDVGASVAYRSRDARSAACGQEEHHKAVHGPRHGSTGGHLRWVSAGSGGLRLPGSVCRDPHRQAVRELERHPQAAVHLSR